MMEKNDIESVLRHLATSDESRSETARLRDIFDSVEAAQRAGVSRAKILEALHAKGFTMALKSFESALYRIRKQKAKATTKGTPALAQVVTPGPANATQPASAGQPAAGQQAGERIEEGAEHGSPRKTADTVRVRRPEIEIDPDE